MRTYRTNNSNLKCNVVIINAIRRVLDDLLTKLGEKERRVSCSGFLNCFGAKGGVYELALN